MELLRTDPRQSRLHRHGQERHHHEEARRHALVDRHTLALFLHPAEAIHGDLGMLATGDVVLAASYSGSTEELLRLVEILKRLAVPLIAITASRNSPIARNADLHLRVAIDQEACPLDLAPTASTTATLALGDALAMALLEAKGFTPEDFARLHPGGQLGKRLLKVHQLMHSGENLPQVAASTPPMREAIYEMSRKKLGITAVTDSSQPAGGLHLGRRPAPPARKGRSAVGEIGRRLSADGASGHPPRRAGLGGLKIMEDHRITSLFVCTEAGELEGIVHLHDLWGLELF